MEYTKLWLVRLKLPGHHPLTPTFAFNSIQSVNFVFGFYSCHKCNTVICGIKSIIHSSVCSAMTTDHSTVKEKRSSDGSNGLQSRYRYSWGANVFLCKDQLRSTCVYLAKVILYHSIVEPFRRDLTSTLTMACWPLTCDLCSWRCRWLLLERQKGHAGVCSCFSEIDSEAATVRNLQLLGHRYDSYLPMIPSDPPPRSQK